MYFLSPLLFSNALVAARDTNQNTFLLDPLTTTPQNDAPAASTKTIFVTETRTIYPTPPYPPPTVSSGTKLTGQPKFTLDTTTTTAVSIQTTVPREGHYTPPTNVLTTTSTGVYPHEPSATSPMSLMSSTSGNAQIRSNTYFAPVASETEGSSDVLSHSTRTEDVSDTLPLPSEDVYSILPLRTTTADARGPSSAVANTPVLSPVSTQSAPLSSSTSGDAMPGFVWPSATLAVPSKTTEASIVSVAAREATGVELSSTGASRKATLDAIENQNENESKDDENESEVETIDNATAWSGTDHAIRAQMHARTFPWLSLPPPRQSKSAAVRRHRQFWDRSGDDAQGERQEKQDCAPCEGEGKVLCYGDVAIGYCRGGCQQPQFLGRGYGCAASSAAEGQCHIERGVAMSAAVLYLGFVM